MGNWSSSTKEPEIEHPKLFGKWPDPYPICKIAPELLIYTQEKRVDESGQRTPLLKIDFNHTPSEAIKMLITSGCLRSCARFVVLTHGFQSSKDVAWLQAMRDTILFDDTEMRQTVAILGWGGGAQLGLLSYGYAAANSIVTGLWLADYIAELRATRPEIATYGVGHSLGAHLMGAAGRHSNAFDRITGLDPAGVGFQVDNQDKRLSQYDAPLVDVIHTDGQQEPYFGTLLPLGLIDFYPNYGWNQPTRDGSRNLKPDLEFDEKMRKKMAASPYGDLLSESHRRSFEYFIWSVDNKNAFRTHLRLDGEPDVEHPIHRVVATGTRGQLEISVEMGYHLDRHLNQQLAKRDRKYDELQPRQEETSDNKMIADKTKYYSFAGCYYVHTNATLPWC